ncbi:MAG: class I mannose-6-phosphate isomerase [Oscillospiraceae bacterium]|jgi:mannose-6-phosphate isomerase|nr:class I mannose-6-phosphate isomerase [Oscillospiraceae bacterium]
MLLKMKENRVWRLYLGGKLLDELHGREGADGFFPEDWLASVVEAINPDRPGKPANEGLSETLLPDGSTTFLRTLLRDAPERWLGEAHCRAFGGNFGVLAKFLDSAERLPIQVHPSKADAQRLFHSAYGKTEAWYILAGRVINGEAPYILLGFREDVTAEQLHALFDAQDIEGMAALMHKIPVRPGEVYLIEGGTPHAIGPGCLLLEVQEPTDYTVSLETHDTAGNAVPEQLIHQGLGFERMFECFNYQKQSLEALLAAFRLEPQSLGEGYEELIAYSRTPCFSLRRRQVGGAASVPPAAQAYALAVTKGEGTVGGVAVRQGDCLFIPAEEAYQIEGNAMELLECFSPAVPLSN